MTRPRYVVACPKCGVGAGEHCRSLTTKPGRRRGIKAWTVALPHPEPTVNSINTGDVVVESQDVHVTDHISRHAPAFVLADVAATRRIIEVAAEVDRKIDAEWGGVREAAELWADGDGYEGREILQLLALPFSDHADYQQGWAL